MGVDFILDDCRLNLCVFKNITDLAARNVAHTDVADEALTDELLHSFPSLLVGHVRVDHNPRNKSFLIVKPAWANNWRLLVLLSDGVVNKVQIQVVNFQVSQ